MEVEPRGEIATQPPDEGDGADAGGVTIGEPQVVGRPSVIGSPQVIGTPQVIGGERAGADSPGSEIRYDPGEDGMQSTGMGGSDAPQAYGGTDEAAAASQDGTGGSEPWVPGQDRVRSEFPELQPDGDSDPSASGWLQEQPDAATPDDAWAEDPEASGWPEAGEEGLGEAGWMQQGAEEEPGVGGSGAADPLDEAEQQETPGSLPIDGGGAGTGEALLSPGLVLGPTDPETGALLAPPSEQAPLAQSGSGGSGVPVQEPGSPDAASSGTPSSPGEDAAAPPPQEELEEALDALTDVNAESVELQEAQLEVLESQRAQQEAVELQRQEEEAAAAMAARQRLRAARLLEQGQLALQDGETDLADELEAARIVLIEEIEIAGSSGRDADLRELSEALDRLDAAVLAADSNNGLEARRWLLDARRLLEGPAGGARGVPVY